MFTAKLRLPATLDEHDLALLSAGTQPAAFAALRDQNNNAAPWTAEWMFEDSPDPETLKGQVIVNAALHEIELPSPLDFQVEEVPERDWLSYSYQQFPAFSVGPFFIYGSHHEGEVPSEQIGLQIDAATAFGSGEHGTTAGCLEAMVYLKDQGLCPWNVIDMGTGSGILAIAAWKLWKTPILAVDNDAQAVRVAEHHRALNHVPGGASDMTCAVGDGFAADIVAQKKPYELVIANILAGPLKEMAGDLVAVCDQNGYVILSGILNEQAHSVIAAYEAQELSLKKHIKIREWTTLILHRPF